MNSKNIKNENNNKDSHEIDNDIDILKILYTKKSSISYITILLTFLLVIYIIFLPNFYKSSSLLKVSYPENNEASSGLSRYAGIASLAGVSLPTTSEDKGKIAIEIIKSRAFLKNLTTFDGVLEKLVATKSYSDKTNTITYDDTIFNSNTGKWIEGRPSYLEAYEYYEDYMSVSQNKATGFISLSYEHMSPIFAYEFTNLIIQELNKLSREKDIKESTDAISFLEGLLDENNQTNIELSINQMIESQLRTKMLSNIRDDYLLSPIDPPYISEKKSSPSRAILSIMSLMFSFIASLLIILLKEMNFYNRK